MSFIFCSILISNTEIFIANGYLRNKMKEMRLGSIYRAAPRGAKKSRSVSALLQKLEEDAPNLYFVVMESSTQIERLARNDEIIADLELRIKTLVNNENEVFKKQNAITTSKAIATVATGSAGKPFAAKAIATVATASAAKAAANPIATDATASVAKRAASAKSNSTATVASAKFNATKPVADTVAIKSNNSENTKKRDKPVYSIFSPNQQKKKKEKVMKKKTATTKSSASGMAAAAASAAESSAATKKVMKAAKSCAATKNSHVEVTKWKSVDDDLGFLDKELSDEDEEVTPKKKPVKKLRLVYNLMESSGESAGESPSPEKKKRRAFGEDGSDASWSGEEY